MLEDFNLNIKTVVVILIFIAGLVISTLRLESTLDKKIAIDHAILERVLIDVGDIKDSQNDMSRDIKDIDKRVIRLETKIYNGKQ